MRPRTATSLRASAIAASRCTVVHVRRVTRHSSHSHTHTHAATLRLDPGFAVAYQNLAALYKEQSRLDLALTYFEEAVRISPEFAECYRCAPLPPLSLGSHPA